MKLRTLVVAAGLLGVLLPALPAAGAVQFPYDIDNMPTGNFPGAEDIDWNADGIFSAPPANYIYKHLGATDGYVKMADGSDTYIFGFLNLTGMPGAEAAMTMNKGEFPAPTLDFKEGDHVYLNLSNLGMPVRPDLFDAHTVHFHGFPQAAAAFDGEPMASFGVNMSSDLTYYYRIAEPGTYMYHCHVEATEHMEMGMLGNLVVRPAQDGTSVGGFTKFAYNDGDGTTGYDVEAIVQFSEFDPEFHYADEKAQPLRFADLEGKYFLLNGRGYPDTIDTGVIANQNGDPTLKLNALIEANQGQRILVRLSNLSVMGFATIEFGGLPVRVVGKCAKLLRGPDGKDITYSANSVHIGPGQSYDIIIDTTGVPKGTYFLYSRNLHHLHNDQMDRGGAMTEIRIN